MTDYETLQESQTPEGELPEGWDWTTLGEIADTERKRVDPQDYDGFAFIGLEHVEAHTMRLLGTSPAIEMKSSAEYFAPGDLLYARLRPYLNKIYYPDFEGLCSSEFIIFRKLPYLENKYLQYFLNSWTFVAFASNLNTGDRPRINFNQIANYQLPLAPLAEQKRIVEAIESLFTELDAGVTALKRLRANLKRYKAAVLKAACEGRLVPQDPNDEPASELLKRILKERRAKWETEQRAKGKDPRKLKYDEPAAPDTSDLPELPEGWVWASLGQIISFIEAGKSFKAEGRPITDGEYGVIKVSAVTWGKFLPRENKALLSEDEFIPEAAIKAFDLLISRANTVELVGAVVLVDHDYPNLMLSDKILRLIPVSEEIPRAYILYALRMKPTRDHFENNATGTSDSMRNLSQPKILAAPIPLPPAQEQNEIVAEIERQVSVVNELNYAIESDLKRAERLRQAILKQAFEGKLVPQDPNDEPASKLLKRIKKAKNQKNS